jgi:chromosome segregation ATPase
MTNGDPESGIREMDEIRDYIDQLRQNCFAKQLEVKKAEKTYQNLTEQVARLRGATHRLGKRVSMELHRANNADRRRRYTDQVRGYIEMLTHKLRRTEIAAQKYNGYNAHLQTEVDRLDGERKDLYKTYKTLRHSTQNVANC